MRETKKQEIMKQKKIQNAEITLSVTDDSDFLSKYSPSNKPVISSEVAEFLEDSVREFHPKAEIKLTIKGDCVDDNEKPIYAEAIKNYFELKRCETERDIHRKTFVSIIFTVIGVIALAAMFLLDAIFKSEIWTECVDIFAWVFIWEAVDQFFIERSGLLMRRKRLENFVNITVEYK